MRFAKRAAGDLFMTCRSQRYILAGCALWLFACAPLKVSQLIFEGPSRTLRKRPEGTPANSPTKPGILLIALDGVDRSILYELLRHGDLPEMARLLGGAEGKFTHADFDDTMLSTLPSSTLSAWTTAMTGVPPSEHGVSGNEFFMREHRRFGAPAPVSFSDSTPTLEIYTDGYMDTLTLSPTVYDRMRAVDPNILSWVAMHQIFAGADAVLLTKPTILLKAFEVFFEEAAAKLTNKTRRSAYEKLDRQVVSVVVDALEKNPVPDVLTVYLSGTDLYAHIAEEGPDEARRAYLREVVDPALGELAKRLHERGALDNRYVVVTSDHGHTEVRFDNVHALGTKGDDNPPAIVKQAGYRLRPFKLEVSEKDDFDAVLAYGGAMAYVYVADRSTCANRKEVCDWKKPPRYEQDVLPLAEAFFKNNQDGSTAPGMKGALDMVLTRRPKPYDDIDLPFEVYVGSGKTMPLADYLQAHPHPTYVAMEERLRDLAVGVRGERAGDILLLAHDGDRAKPDERFYFAGRYHSWHGSPSRKDSEIPFIVANPKRSSASLRAQVNRILGAEPHRQQKVTDVLLELREGRFAEAQASEGQR